MVAGVRAGVGATTVAVALHGRDAGTSVDGADVLVCRSDVASLTGLGALVERGLSGPRPALAVILDPAAPPGARTRLAAAVAGLGRLTVLPHVAALRDGRLPPAQLETLLSRPPGRLDGPATAYAAALRELAASLVTCGRLAGEPAPRRVRTLWRGLGPVERRSGGGAAVDLDELDDLDDLAVEAAQPWPVAG